MFERKEWMIGCGDDPQSGTSFYSQEIGGSLTPDECRDSARLEAKCGRIQGHNPDMKRILSRKCTVFEGLDVPRCFQRRLYQLPYCNIAPIGQGDSTRAFQALSRSIRPDDSGNAGAVFKYGAWRKALEAVQLQPLEIHS